MAESTIDMLETIADATIVTLSAWAGWLFWSNYRRTRASRAGILAAIFGFVAVFKTLQLIFEFTGLETFAWMDTNLASEVLIILFVAINIYVLYSGTSWKGRRLSQQPGEAIGENRNKAA